MRSCGQRLSLPTVREAIKLPAAAHEFRGGKGEPLATQIKPSDKKWKPDKSDSG
jgi:hypothetical protein